MHAFPDRQMLCAVFNTVFNFLLASISSTLTIRDSATKNDTPEKKFYLLARIVILKKNIERYRVAKLSTK